MTPIYTLDLRPASSLSWFSKISTSGIAEIVRGCKESSSDDFQHDKGHLTGRVSGILEIAVLREDNSTLRAAFPRFWVNSHLSSLRRKFNDAKESCSDDFQNDGVRRGYCHRNGGWSACGLKPPEEHFHHIFRSQRRIFVPLTLWPTNLTMQ